MDSLSADIVTLNQKVLYIALDQAAIKINKRSLRFNNHVSDIITSASSEACKIAINCSVPLVEFQKDALELLHRRFRSIDVELLSEDLKEFNTLGLIITQKIAIARELSAKIFYNLNNVQLEILKNLSYNDLTRIACHNSDIFKLRLGEDQMFWDQILIGRRIPGKRGELICRERALLSLSGKKRVV